MTKNQRILLAAASFFLGLVYCQTVFGSSSKATVTRSAVESLRDHGVYIIYFKNDVPEIKLQHFVTVLERKSKLFVFIAEIIGKFLDIKCLTAKLSKKALRWVRMQLCMITKATI